ncbi:MAG TPA: NADH-quinone oxidoreductase subunit C [Dehalococcoidia bacterium]|nr:NADH-quinone oxidoreductase subunit C [Dehalococcoidia bacterium]
MAEFHPQPGALGDLPQLTVEAQHIAQVCRRAKEDPRLDFKMLHCLAGVDYQDHLQVVYFLHSLSQERTLVIKANVPADAPRLPSVTTVWAAADWYEREAHDLFGISFDGHPNMAPLVLYEGFEGYPGRKSFPFNDYQEF